MFKIQYFHLHAILSLRAALVLTLSFCLLSVGGIAQDKAAKADEAAAKKQAKQERRYKKIKDFALDKYNKDPDFKDSVDDAYRAIREAHTSTLR